MIIGLTGAQSSGKSTVAGMLEVNHGFKIVDIGGFVREAALALDPHIVTKDGAQILSDLIARYGWETAKRSPVIRRLLTRLSKDLVRDCLDPKFWERKTMAAIFALEDAAHREGEPQPKIVVTSIKMPEERTLVEEIWAVKRSETSSQGPSMLEVYAVEIINNDGTIKDLERLVEEAVRGAEQRRTDVRAIYGKKIRR